MAENKNDQTGRDLLPAERQDMILSLLTRQSVVTVTELASLLNTTEITVRRDLTILANAGLLKRVRGGAMSLSGTTTRAGSLAPSFAAPVPAPDGISDIPLPAGIDDPNGAKPVIGVMLPEPSFFWPNVIESIRDTAGELGARVVSRESSYDKIDETEILDWIAKEPSLCGIILSPSGRPEIAERTWDWIAHSPVPVVVVERDQPVFGTCYVDSVRTNHHFGVRKAAVHFLQHGHTRIGAAFSDTPTSGVIENGWKHILNDSDRIDCPFILDGIQPYDTSGVDGIVDKIIDTGVTAMLVHSDYLAIAIAQVLERRGKRVPDDVSLISIDGYATPSSRPLTVLRSNSKELGEICVRTLMQRIADPEAATRHIFVDPTLVDRGSVATIA
ncbi:substrate-binding domain-containing protein [Bifidobacterium avesanii]|nr:substrate-binding domain-containing protein [Bifidobacterium avesanii]KAB8289722.1 DeoR family transcriptional regulator [Bifidobacterium avesanii]